jgi:hypothetical protein
VSALGRLGQDNKGRILETDLAGVCNIPPSNSLDVAHFCLHSLVDSEPGSDHPVELW